MCAHLLGLMAAGALLGSTHLGSSIAGFCMASFHHLVTIPRSCMATLLEQLWEEAGQGRGRRCDMGNGISPAANPK